MYAEGGSWAAVAGDRRFWGAQSDVRSTLAGGAGEVFYPILVIAPSLVNLRIPVSQQFTGGLVKLGYEAREHLWLNAGFKFARTEIRATGIEITEEGRNLALAPEISIDLAMLDLSAEWDSRSDQFYPRDGSLVSLDVGLSNEAWGADRDYTVYEISYDGYRALGESHTLAWRLAGKTVTGDPPFFALAWYGSGVDLRGYTPGTYIGKSLAAAQAEWRWQATKRIGLVAFGGVGGVWGDVPFFEQDDFLPAGGVGLRWRLTEKFRVNFRIDYAWGKDDEVLLISVGEAF
jgi:outer membrane protein assembly factor BamA